MSASKEDARKANEDLEKATQLLDGTAMSMTKRTEIKRYLLRVQDFIEAAIPRLPSQAAIDRDKQRNRAARP